MRILRASLLSLLLLCLLTGSVNAQTCPPPFVITTLHDTTCLSGSIYAAVTNPSLYTNITWSAQGAPIYPNGASAAAEVNDSSVSEVSITAHATDVATGCAVSSTVVIPVVPLNPPPMFVSSDGPLCYDSAVTISIPPQPAGSEIIWDYTGARLGGGNGQNFITLPAGPSFSLRVRLTDPRLCTTQNTITVPPVHIPVVPVLQADDRYGCAYAVKTVTLTNPSAYTSYSWSVTNGTIIGANDQPTVHIGLLAAGTNTNVILTASDGTCPITGSAGFYSTQPSAAITLPGGPYCAGRNATLFANTDGFFHPTYLWSNGATTSSITVAPDAPGPYTVTVTNEYGCSTTSAPVTVPLEPTDTSISATGPTTFCAGGHVFLAPIMPGQSYLWSNGATTQTIDVTQSGDYSVTVNTGQCSYVGPAVHVTVNPLPAATITASGPVALCPGGSVTLTASAASSYAWSNGATTQSITVNAAGSYGVTVTNASGCSATSAATVVTVNPNPFATITAGGPTTFCAGGSVTLTASAGASYLWSTGATTQSIAAGATGNYTVVVTNANGCSTTSAATAVTATPLPAATITASGPTTFCAGGSVTLTSSSGAWYLWSNGATTPSITVSSTGNYSVAVTNAAGCTATSTPATVTVNPNPTATITAGGPLAICPNGGSVVLTANASGSYAWSNGPTTQSITVTQPGSYSVVVTTGGCSTTSSPTVVTLRNPGTISGSTTFCGGGSTTLTAPVAAAYLWSNGATTRSITVSTAGSYSVTLDDGAGCSMTTPPVTVAKSPLAVVVSASATTICDTQTATFTAVATGGSGYTYQWMNGMGPIAGATALTYTTNVDQGYYVVVTDGSGCSVSSISNPIMLRVNPTPAGGFYFPPASFCSGGTYTVSAFPLSGDSYSWTVTNGTVQSLSNYSAIITAGTSGNVVIGLTISKNSGCSWTGTKTIPIVPLPPVPAITASGPTTFCQGDHVTLTAPAGYSYVWRIGSTVIGGDQQSFYTGISGSYTVTVTNANGCSTTSAPTVVNANPLPTPTITPAGGPATFCAGGAVALTASSATSYLWSTGETTQMIFVNTSGNYSVTLTNASGCSATSAPITVTVNPNPVATITAAGPTTFCPGGSVTLTASTAASYLWSTGATTQSIVASSSGNYTVKVTDANGCSATSAPITVTVNPNPVATITAAGPTTFCAGGSVTLTASTAASYLWSTGATTQSIVASSSGNYSVTLTNASGCSATSAPITVTVNPNPAATITAGGPTTFCPGGSVTLTASTAVSYLWSTGATTQSIVASSSGNYTVRVTDANGCSATSSPAVVTVNPNPPVGITASGSTTFCAGGSVTLTASSAASYLWSTGATTQSIVASSSGNYTVSVTDANGCSATSAPAAVTVIPNPPATITAGGPTTFCAGGSVTLTASASPGASYYWSSGERTQSITATSSRNYIVTVISASGCSTTSAPTLVTINPPPVASITVGGPASFCEGGSVTLTASAAASYLWSTGATTRSIVASTSGNYTVSITDANGCSSGASAPATVTVNTISPSIVVEGPLTYCDSATSTILNGSPLTGTWFRNGVAVSTTARIFVHDFGTGTGSYVWRATNSSGCTKDSDPVVVTINPSANLGLSTGFLCWNGTSDAQSAEASPGTTYQWSVTNGTILSGNGTRSIVYAAAAGATTVGVDWTVTTAAGCAGTNHFDVSVDVMQTTVSASGPTTFCSGGSVVLTTTAVPGAGYYQWSNGAQGQSITVTASGTYSVHAIRATNGCVGKESNPVSVTVQTLPAATITAGGPTTFCAGGNVMLTASSGSSYLWSNGATTQSIVANTSGSYSVTVTNASGCSATSAATQVTVNAAPTPSITPGGPTTFCAGGSVTLTAPAGYTYTWSNGATTQSITVSTSGSYSVTARDANGCSGTSAPTAVTVRPRPAATVSGGGAICLGGSTTITAALTGTAPWSVTWSDNVTQTINSGTTATRTVNPSITTTYTVTTASDAACSGTSSGSAVVTMKPRPAATVSGGGTICPAASATITATLTGIAPWSVTWSDNVTQTINSGTTASRTVSPAATTTYTVTSVSDANCSGTSSGSAVVTVKPVPTATVSGGGTFCPGVSTTITAALTGTAPFTVIWSDNVTQTINSGTTASRTVSPAATTTYTVTSVTDAKSCPRPGTGSATVTRNTAASITTQPANKTTTRNTSVTLSVVAAGTAPISYQWFKSGVSIAGATSSSYTTSFPNKGTNTFYVEVWNACNTTHVKSTTVTVTVN